MLSYNLCYVKWLRLFRKFTMKKQSWAKEKSKRNVWIANRITGRVMVLTLEEVEILFGAYHLESIGEIRRRKLSSLE